MLFQACNCGQPADDCRSELPERRATSNPDGVDVLIDTASPKTGLMLVGPLNGTNYHDPVNRSYFDAANARLEGLAPTAWRVAGTKHASGGDSGFGAVLPFLTDYGYPRKFGTKITLNLQEIFVAEHGKPIRLAISCGPKQRDCFTSFEKLREAWNAELGDFLTGQGKNHCADQAIDFFELGSEPEFHSYVGVTTEQSFLLMLDAHRLVRACRPGARVVGPSTVAWNQKLMESFFAFATANSMRIDAVSWHEFGDDAVPRYSPNAVQAHVDACKALFQQFPAICEGGCPELHINEFQGGSLTSSPGHAVSWLEALEAAGITSANPGCWDAPLGSKSINTCFDGFSGFLQPEPSTEPTPLYWIYRYRSSMSSRFSTSTSPSELSVLSGALRSGGMGVLIGNGGLTRQLRGACEYSGINREAQTVVTLKNLPATQTSAQISVFQVSTHPNEPAALDLATINTYGVAQSDERLVRTSSAQVSNGVLQVSLPPIAAGDALWVVIR